MHAFVRRANHLMFNCEFAECRKELSTNLDHPRACMELCFLNVVENQMREMENVFEPFKVVEGILPNFKTYSSKVPFFFKF